MRRESGMGETPRFETGEDIECPDCGHQVPIRAQICPHCETALY
jgi:predicted RNA-binding Zn-ribbon protein involved in translation (DUF1610 family)